MKTSICIVLMKLVKSKLPKLEFAGWAHKLAE